MRTIKSILIITIALMLVFILSSSAISGQTHVSITETGSHESMSVADSDNEATESNKANTEKTFIFSAVSPDLIIQDVTWSPVNPSAGDTITFTVIIKNQGSERADSSHVAYYIDEVYLTLASIPPIDPGASITRTFTWTAQAGSHALKAIADSDNEVTESNEANNEKTFAFSAVAPDLIIQDLTWSPANPSVGDMVTFTAIIKNQGSERANASSIHFYIDGNSRGNYDVQRIEIDATTTTTFTWTAQTGSHSIKAVADSNNQLIEGDETNNEKTITFLTHAPDLIVQDLTWSPENPSKGDTVTFNIIIKNQGTGKTESFHVAYYIDDISHDSIYFNSINVSATDNTTFTWTARAGTHAIKIVADSFLRVIESDETNNEKTFAFSTNDPDLIVQDITWSPANPSAGDTVTFTATIKNQGTGKADSSRLAYYIGGSYSGLQNVQTIDADATANTTFTWIAEAGSRTITAIVDSHEEVVESDETNNEKTVDFSTIDPDLIVQDITWSPASPSVGDMVTFTVTVKNQGTGRAESSRLAYYIDGVSQNSIYFNSIDAGATDNTTFTWTTEAGSHIFKLVADFIEEVLESDETNNEKTITFSTPIPDLIIQDITWSPANPSAGDTVTFTVTIKNQGTGMADPSRIAYYIDGSSRGYRDVQGMDIAATVLDTFTWTAQAGSHIIKVVADSDNQVIEDDENNNSRTAILPPPDLIIQDITWSPENPSVGDTITFTITVKNQGGNIANSSDVAYYINDVHLASIPVNSIDPGAIDNITFTWIAQAGSHIIRVVADYNNLLSEADENNNSRTAILPPPDLIVQDITWSPESPSAGDTITFTVTIKNRSISRADSSNVTYYIDGVYLASTPVNPIDPGATDNITFTWIVQAGSHTVKAVADFNNEVNESDETNNTKTMAFSTLVPDLVIQDITWSPASPSVGDMVTFTVTIKNQGTGGAGTSRLDYYIDDSLQDSINFDSIGPGATDSNTFTWIMQAGSHAIRAIVDSNNEVNESDETNNTKNITLSLPVKAGGTQETGFQFAWQWIALSVGLLIAIIAVIKIRAL